MLDGFALELANFGPHLPNRLGREALGQPGEPHDISEQHGGFLTPAVRQDLQSLGGHDPRHRPGQITGKVGGVLGLVQGLDQRPSSTVFERSSVSGPWSWHVWFASVPSEDLHQMTGRDGVLVGPDGRARPLS
jgi:hypothetical protein